MASCMGECGESLLIIVKLEMVAVIISGYNHGIITSKSWDMGFPITMIIHLELTISNIISRFFFRLGGLEV